jgi:hypothetical protein
MPAELADSDIRMSQANPSFVAGEGRFGAYGSYGNEFFQPDYKIFVHQVIARVESRITACNCGSLLIHGLRIWLPNSHRTELSPLALA